MIAKTENLILNGPCDARNYRYFKLFILLDCYNSRAKIALFCNATITP